VKRERGNCVRTALLVKMAESLGLPPIAEKGKSGAATLALPGGRPLSASVGAVPVRSGSVSLEAPAAPGGRPSVGARPRLSLGGGGNKCKVCNKTVYPNEQIAYDKQFYHAECFKCLKCKSRVPLVNVAMISGDLYCKACFKRIFAEKGKYTSFGDKVVSEWDKDKDRRASASVPPPVASAAPGGDDAKAPAAAPRSSISEAPKRKDDVPPPPPPEKE